MENFSSFSKKHKDEAQKVCTLLNLEIMQAFSAIIIYYMD